MIGLVPQELTTNAFETVWDDVSFSRGLFGKPRNPALIEKLLQGPVAVGQEGRQDHHAVGRHEAPVMIAKALSHEPEILFLDEPTAGVDVELGATCGSWCARCATTGVTIILTTHYIEEAEEMADRVGVINKGELILVEEKAALMRKLGKKQLTLELQQPARGDSRRRSPAYPLELAKAAASWSSPMTRKSERTGITALLGDLGKAGIRFKDLQTSQSSLEDIFVNLVRAAHDEPSRRARRSTCSRWRGRSARCCRASSRRSFRPRSISSSSARRSARASPRSTASATAPSSCPG